VSRTTAQVALLIALAACANNSPKPDSPAPVDSTSRSAASAAPVASSSPPAADSSAPVASAAPIDAGAADAAPPPIVADNKVPPSTDDAELQGRAKQLFDAVVKDDPDVGESMWFPKEPFIPLKDIKDPAKYWGELHRAYGKDIHLLHKQRPSWDGCTFDKLEPGSTPKWVKPGEEVNKIGYYRSFRWALQYKTPTGADSFEVHVVITWQGRWFVTHLRKFK